jgi:hypothetical protein
MAILASDRETGDEMMQHELMQDDDARTATESIDDPTVRIGVVANVVDGDIGVGDWARATRPNGLDVDELLELRKEQCGVVRDA